MGSHFKGIPLILNKGLQAFTWKVLSCSSLFSGSPKVRNVSYSIKNKKSEGTRGKVCKVQGEDKLKVLSPVDLGKDTIRSSVLRLPFWFMKGELRKQPGNQMRSGWWWEPRPGGEDEPEWVMGKSSDSLTKTLPLGSPEGGYDSS